MEAAALRRASGDPVKRATFAYQWWLARWRSVGGSSSAPEARYIRRRLREVRG